MRRFLDAQDRIYEQVVEELAKGRKETHWMWFIFPQLAGLGRRAMAEHYATVNSETPPEKCYSKYNSGLTTCTA
jgi:uncharacterized protein (DUF1810 family)